MKPERLATAVPALQCLCKEFWQTEAIIYVNIQISMKFGQTRITR